MATTDLERRMRKLEGRRSGTVAFYLAWGRTHEDADQALQRAWDAGTVSSRGDAAVLVWPDPDPVPPSRWITLGGGRQCPVAGREREVLRGSIASEIERRTASHSPVMDMPA